MRFSRIAEPQPVLVELFTSEGCSSCPSADVLLERLARAQPVPGARVLALGFHVDYWNRLGWADPYSHRAFSDRQSAYGAAFRNESVYTPQMVVDGQAEFVGSDEAKARAAVARAARTPGAKVTVEGNGDRVTVRVRDLPPGVRRGGETLSVYAAVTEDGLRSDVKRGENAGRRLTHAAVVRRLTRLGTLSPAGEFTGSVSVAPERGWRRENLRVVAFVQGEKSRRVWGAGAQ